MLKLTKTIFLLIAIGLFFSGSKEVATPLFQKVTISNPIQKNVVEWEIYSGHLESPQIVNVSTRVSGVITEAPFVKRLNSETRRHPLCNRSSSFSG